MANAIQGKPLVTFALFAYNQEDYIRESVNAALSQTYSPLEIILSDDCSTDRTFEIICEMAEIYCGKHRLEVRRSERNLGFADHINSVLAHANGEIISWSAGDDIPFPERTAIFVASLLENDELVGVHSNLEEIDIKGRFVAYREHSMRDYDTQLGRVIRYGQSVITQSHAFKKVAFDRFGPFRSDLTQEGIGMAFRESAIGRVAFVNSPLTKYRIGSGVSTYAGRDLKMRKELEPIKYTMWYLSAFKQMLDDAKRIPEIVTKGDLEIISKNIEFYTSLMEINTGEGIVAPLLKNFFVHPTDTKSVRAVLRRLVPEAIYKVLRC